MLLFILISKDDVDMQSEVGKIVIYIGILLLIVGVLIYFFGHKLSWIGHLPGDIRIEKENFKFYFPIVSLVIISIIINLLVRLYRYIF